MCLSLPFVFNTDLSYSGIHKLYTSTPTMKQHFSLYHVTWLFIITKSYITIVQLFITTCQKIKSVEVYKIFDI